MSEQNSISEATAYFKNYDREEISKEQWELEESIAQKESEAGRFVAENMHKLPQELQDYWLTSGHLVKGSGFMDKASKYIDIPHPDVW